MASVALETGSKIDSFSGLPGGTPEFRQRTSGKVTALFQGTGLLPGGTPEFRQCASGKVTALFQGAGKQHSYRYHPAYLPDTLHSLVAPRGRRIFKPVSMLYF